MKLKKKCSILQWQMANSKLTLSINAMLNLDSNNNCVNHLLFVPQA